MVAERQQRYPKGTYRLSLPRRGTQAGYSAVNLLTREHLSADSFWALMRAIDRDLDSTRFPQYTVKLRTWGGRAQTGPQAPAAWESSSRRLRPATAAEPPGAGGRPFLLQVIHRDNATWQGALQALDGSPMQPFASELELIQLIG